jgi:hypothetical protein
MQFMHALKELHVSDCVQMLDSDWAHVLVAYLPHLETLKLGFDDTHVCRYPLWKAEMQGLNMLLQLQWLSTLELDNVHVSDACAVAIGNHQCLSALRMHECCLSPLALRTIVVSSSSLSTLDVRPMIAAYEPVLREALHQNVHILHVVWALEIFGCRNPHVSRNMRLLHNWRCICLLLASYRANARSPIRDSILSLVRDIMHFLVPDDWYVVP